MLVDVGTNTEVIVGNAEADGSCIVSCGSPHLKAVVLNTACLLIPGAIESVKWNGSQFDYRDN